MPRLPSDTLLMIVDVQNAIDDPKWGPRNNPDAENRIAALLAAWRDAGMPVMHVRHDSVEPHSPYRPDAPGHRFKDEVLPLAGEAVVGKSTNSAFIGTGLDDELTERGITTIVVCGVLTHNSLDATVRHAALLGYRVIVPGDACWSVDVRDVTGRRWAAEDVHQLSLAMMNGGYAAISSVAELVHEATVVKERDGRPWRHRSSTDA